MQPSNPTNNQPLIYRICDAAGVFHLVAPVYHTHAQSEIYGLETALSGKQNTLTFDTTPTAGSNNPVTSGGVKAAIENHIHSAITREDFQSGEYAQVYVLANGAVGIQTTQGFGISLTIDGMDKQLIVDADTINNLIRASQSPDSTPISNSSKLVTSGGVKAAIDSSVAVTEFNKEGDDDILDLSNLFANLVADEIKQATVVVYNIGSNEYNLEDFFTADSEHASIFYPYGSMPQIGIDEFAVCKIIGKSNGSMYEFYVICDGKFGY